MAGWVEERSKGRWRLNVPGGTDTDGKRIVYRKIVDAKSEREAKKILDLFSAEVQKGEYIEPSKLTFTEFVDHWFKNYGDNNLAPKTLFRYKQILNTRVLPAMGHFQVEQIKPFHLIQFYANLQEKGIREDGRTGSLSDRTILHHHRIISAILQDAVEWQIIPFNPASRVKPPKVQKKVAACYDEEQIAQLLEALNKESLKHRVLVYLALFTGLRRGELMGLEWSDINFDKGTLAVQRASQYLPKLGILTKEPKNENSIRLLSLPPFLVDMLKEYKKEQAEARLKVGDVWQGSNRVFTTWDGRPGHPEWPSQWFSKFIKSTTNVKEAFNDEIKTINDKQSIQNLTTLRDQYIKLLVTVNSGKLTDQVLKVEKENIASVEQSIASIIGEEGLERIRKYNLQHLNFHGLRHTAATMLINQGLPAKNISGRLGHANISTTMDIYGHYLKSADREAADRLEQVYQKMKDSGKDAKKGRA